MVPLNDLGPRSKFSVCAYNLHKVSMPGSNDQGRFFIFQTQITMKFHLTCNLILQSYLLVAKASA